MRRANIKGALVGVEAVTPEGLKDVFIGFNDVGEPLVQRLRTFRDHGVYVLGSCIFGLPSDRAIHIRGDGRSDKCLSTGAQGAGQGREAPSRARAALTRAIAPAKSKVGASGSA